jgi:hypothetical protein
LKKRKKDEPLQKDMSGGTGWYIVMTFLID